MALTLKQRYELGRASALIERIVPALYMVSSGVYAEPANQPYPAQAPLGSSMNVTRSAKRQAMALAVRAQPFAFTERFARELAANATIAAAVDALGAAGFNSDGTLSAAGAAAVTDVAIVRECANSWDQQSGVLPSETP